MGASLLFPPQHETAVDARDELLHLVRRDPHELGHNQSRWTLRRVIESCDWLSDITEAGLSRLFDRLGISYKRGRDYVHSPDPHYMAKLDYIEQCRRRVQAEPHRYVLLYLDELTYYQQPSLSRDYEQRGPNQPFARRSYQRDRCFRVLGAMNAQTGQVTYVQRSKVDIEILGSFFGAIRAAYSDAEQIYVVMDNWPVHFHPDVLAYLQPQHFPWPPYVPSHWQASRQPKQTNLPIQLLCLPTYASWCNPIEKLWRWLKQDRLHLHRRSNDWSSVRELVTTFLDQFRRPSESLLRYTGLLRS